MPTQPYKHIRFEWLLTPQRESTVILPDEGDVPWQDYPIPPDIGKGGFENLSLPLGMSLFRARHKFPAPSQGKLISFTEVFAEFKTPVFQVQSIRGGRIEHLEQHPEANLRYTPNGTLFRLTDRFRLTPLFEGGSQTEMVCLTLAQDTLSLLIGDEFASTLYRKLGLTESPQSVVRPIPVRISTLLHDALPRAEQAPLRKLLAQTKCLEYLGALTSHFCSPDSSANPSNRAHQRSHEIRDQLLTSQGKPPSLTTLATQYGRSAKLLNDEFKEIFGTPIHNFILDHRLNQAHAAIEQSNIPLKTLAASLGYRHISNFTNAFKKKFGYPPGKLRKE